MEPIEFEGQNIIFAKDQPEYLPLPAHKSKGIEGEVISCWKLTFKERLKILFSGKLWLKILTFNHPLQPIGLDIDKPDLINKPPQHPNCRCVEYKG